MPKQQISANQVSVGTAGSGSVLTSNGTNAYWSNTLTVTANALVLSAGSNTSPALKFTSGNTLFVANAGVIEYTGTAFYATPVGQQRGVIPGQQMFILDTAWVGNATSTTAQGIFGTGVSGNGIGVTLSSNTTYAFETFFILSKSAGTTSHTIAFAYGGTANTIYINYNGYNGFYTTYTNGFVSGTSAGNFQSNTVSAVVITGALTAAGATLTNFIKGTVVVNNGGTFIPQYVLSAAPGGAYSTLPGSYFLIYPISTGSANISIGTWA
jgi:hypothetical protein